MGGTKGSSSIEITSYRDEELNNVFIDSSRIIRNLGIEIANNSKKLELSTGGISNEFGCY
jgi:hypothetical protein